MARRLGSLVGRCSVKILPVKKPSTSREKEPAEAQSGVKPKTLVLVGLGIAFLPLLPLVAGYKSDVVSGWALLCLIPAIIIWFFAIDLSKKLKNTDGSPGFHDERPTVEEARAEQHQTATQDGRVPCPVCAERVMPTATLCPFCKQAIFSRDKGTNAVAGVVVYVIVFLILFYALMEFAHHQGNKEYDRLMRDIRSR